MKENIVSLVEIVEDLDHDIDDIVILPPNDNFSDNEKENDDMNLSSRGMPREVVEESKMKMYRQALQNERYGNERNWNQTFWIWMDTGDNISITQPELKELNCFQLFKKYFNDAIVNLIVEESNRFIHLRTMTT